MEDYRQQSPFKQAFAETKPLASSLLNLGFDNSTHTTDHSHDGSPLENAPIDRVHSLRDQIRPITDGVFPDLIGLWLALI